MSNMQIKTKRLTPEAKLPTYATDGSGCFDIYTTNSGLVDNSFVFDTGLSFEIPVGYVMLVFSRSGHGFKNDIRLANCVGIIDSDYRGELKVKLTNDGEDFFVVHVGERIAQAMVIPFEQVQFLEVDDLSETERGAGGFGSTGVQ
jgi:dUTP pyrophosphatase